VVVTAEAAPLPNADTGGLEHTLENKLIEDLPSAERSTLAPINNIPGVIDMGFALAQGENLNTNGNAQGPVGSPGNRNFFDTNFGVSGGQASTNDVLWTASPIPWPTMRAGDLSELLQPVIRRNVTNNTDGGPPLFGQIYTELSVGLRKSETVALGDPVMPVRDCFGG
jgi:hypothetical protein